MIAVLQENYTCITRRLPEMGSTTMEIIQKKFGPFVHFILFKSNQR